LQPTFASYREVATRSHAFQSLAVTSRWQPTLTTTDGAPERLEGQRVSASYFPTLGIAPALGRGFDSTEDRPRGRNEVILSNGLWLRRFGGDPGVIGRDITLDGVPYTCVAVMPPTFENIVEPTANAWTLLQYDASLAPGGPEWFHNLSTMIGRLRPGISRGAADRDLATIARLPVSAFARPPWATMGKGLSVTSMKDDATRAVRPVMLAVLAAVAILLLASCANVTNLVVARGARRRGEMALRSALGAVRGRLVAQLLSEAVVLAVAGGVIGIFVASAALDGLLAIAPADLPRASAIRLDGAALAFGILLSVVVGVATGLLPALASSRATVQHALQDRRSTAAAHPRLRGALVVGQLALAVTLLVCTGLLMRSLTRLFDVNPGFDPANVLTMQLRVSGPRFTNDTVTRTFYGEVLDAVRHVPGVAAAALTSQVPLSGDRELYGVHFESSPAGHNAPEVVRYAVTPGFFETMRITATRGRVLDASDRAGAPLAAVFNQSFAARVFPGENPIGMHVHIGADDGPWYTVVGIIPDIKQIALGAKPMDEVFVTTEQSSFADRTMSVVARTSVPPTSAATAIEQAIWSVDRSQAVSRVAPMTELLRASESQRRFALLVFEAFGAAALLLATIGTYGTLATGVVERFREIGIRLALGATPDAVRRLILRQAAWLTVGGIGLGALGAIAATRAVQSLLFGVATLDFVTYALVVSIVALAALVACWLPASRAAAVDPAITLQAE
jgi:putative ABC transport system permease protein